MEPVLHRSSRNKDALPLRLHLVGAAIAAIGLLLPVEAQAQSCPHSVIPGPGFFEEQWLFSRASKICEVFTITTPSVKCTLWRDPHHAQDSVSCGKDFDDVRWSTTFSGPLMPDNSELTAKHRFPPLVNERKSWLAHVDREWMRWCEDCDGEVEFVRLYPKTFSYVGPIEAIENPDFEARFQRLDYETVGGLRRIAFTASATYGCVAMRFIAWREPGSEAMMTRDFKQFLGALRLEQLRTLTAAERKYLRPFETAVDQRKDEAATAKPAACVLP